MKLLFVEFEVFYEYNIESSGASENSSKKKDVSSVVVVGLSATEKRHLSERCWTIPTRQA